MKKLTPKQKAFADNYLINGYNATQAYKDAGYKWKNDNVAKASASQLLANPNVNDYISKRLKRIEKKVETKQISVHEAVNKLIADGMATDFTKTTNTRVKRIEVDEETGLPIEIVETTQRIKPSELTRILELKARLEGLLDNVASEEDTYTVIDRGGMIDEEEND